MIQRSKGADRVACYQSEEPFQMLVEHIQVLCPFARSEASPK